MPRRIRIVDHLTTAELGARFRQATDVIERGHYQTIWLLTQGRSTEEVASVTGYRRDWVYKLVRRYNQDGPGAIGDQRHQNAGAPTLLDDVQQAQLLQALEAAPVDGDLWDGPKVAQWMSELLGFEVYPQRGWEYLRAMEMRLLKPRPEHVESDEMVQHQWKKPQRNGRSNQRAVSRSRPERLGRR